MPLLSTLIRRASLDFSVRTKAEASALIEELRTAAGNQEDALALAMVIIDSQKRADEQGKSGKETGEGKLPPAQTGRPSSVTFAALESWLPPAVFEISRERGLYVDPGSITLGDVHGRARVSNA